jgi:hypothetical protein
MTLAQDIVATLRSKSKKNRIRVFKEDDIEALLDQARNGAREYKKKYRLGALAGAVVGGYPFAATVDYVEITCTETGGVIKWRAYPVKAPQGKPPPHKREYFSGKYNCWKLAVI